MKSGQKTAKPTAQPDQANTPESSARAEFLQYNNLAIPRRADPRELRRAIENPRLTSPASVLQIQRTYGNQAFLRLQKAAQLTVRVRTIPPLQRIQAPLIQRLVTQIVANDTGDTIQDIHIIGRPTRTFTDSMGDHSTAFSVHTASLKLKLIGKTYKEAVLAVNAFVDASKKLPGLKLKDNLARNNEVEMLYEDADDEETGMELDQKQTTDPELEDDDEAEAEERGGRISRAPHGNRLDAAENEMNNLRAAAESQPSFLNLQNYINVYLEFRELIPLSVFNIGDKFKNSSGKGKGESRPVKLLSLHEKNPEQFVPTITSQLQTRQATALANIRKNENMIDETKKANISKTTAQYDTLIKNLPEKKAEYLREAIYAAFDSQAAGIIGAEVREDLVKAMAPGLTIDIESTKRIEMIVSQHILSIQTSFPQSFKESGINQKELELLVKKITKSKLEGELNFYQTELTKAENRRTTFQQNNANRKFRKGSNGERTKVEIKHLSDAKTYDDVVEEEQAKVEAVSKVLNAYKGIATNSASQLEVLSMSRSLANKQTLATQVVLDNEGKITELNFAGRSPSPFSGTMGAHTTAWRVHLDVILAKLLGKSIEAAINEIDQLIQEAVTTYNKFKEHFKAHHTHTAKADSALKQLKSTQQKIKGAEPQAKAFMLQQYINELLTYINFTPGATLESADTGGKTEGKHRKTIREFQADQTKHTKEAVKKAIWELLDIKVAKSSTHNALEKHHLEQIAIAYPVAFNAVFKGGAKLRSEDERLNAIEEEKAANTKKGTKRKNRDDE